jgi:hypothetical protein
LEDILNTSFPNRFGYDSAFIGTTIARESFKSDFNVVPSQAKSISSNITASFQAGAFFGAIFCFLSMFYASTCASSAYFENQILRR